MDSKTKETLIKAALRGELDADRLPKELLSHIGAARDLTPEEERALKEKAEELRGNPDRLRELWEQMGLR